MQFLVGQITGYETADDRLSAVKVAGLDGVTRNVPLDALLVFYGLSPKLGPIADWGLALNRRQLTVDTEKFETSVPGIFAVGDINTYPGKKKLILCGFHEAALAAFGAAAYIFPGQEDPSAIHHHQHQAARRARCGVSNLRLSVRGRQSRADLRSAPDLREHAAPAQVHTSGPP
jgi:pyruvate/2-oxoglutarate dehydrogenase complex dihydrolipoamide dehydrogenase (E3) component